MNRLLAGALIGLAIGLLIAPDKGSTTRRELNFQYNKLRRKFKRMIGMTNAEMDVLQDSLKAEIAGLQDDVKDRILSIFEESRAAAIRARKKMYN